MCVTLYSKYVAFETPFIFFCYAATKPRSRSRTPEKSEATDSMGGIGKGGARFMKKPAAATRTSPKASPKSVKTTAQPAPKPEPKAVPTPQKSQFYVPTKDTKAKPSYMQDDTDSSSMSIGKGGAKFLKKKPAESLPEKVDSPKSPRVKKTKVNKKMQGMSFIGIFLEHDVFD